MARHSVEISRTAERQLRALPAEDRARVVETLTALADDPRPRGARKLSGYTDVYRVRVGVHRVLYSVEGTRLVVIMLKIGHRRDVYRS
jgi:mRNA interferase RelE/StbE